MSTNKSSTASSSPPAPLAVADLRWRCDPARLAFETTDDVEPIQEVVGQDAAVASLRFGLSIDAPGQNVFVRGIAGTGRLTAVQQMLESMAPPRRNVPDYVYVHDFARADKPRLLALPTGTACDFRDRMEAFAEVIEEDLGPALSDQVVRAKRAAIDDSFQAKSQEISAPFDEELRQRELALVQVQAGDGGVRPAVVPLVDGQPVPPEQLEGLVAEGKVPRERADGIERELREALRKFEEVGLQLHTVRKEHADAVNGFLQDQARAFLERSLAGMRRDYGGEDVGAFLDEVVEDCVMRRLPTLAEDTTFTNLYLVNVLLSCDGTGAPVVLESVPTLGRLVGRIEPTPDEDGQVGPLHLAIQAGSLLRANGGFLILEAREVVQRPEAWAALMRTLRSGSCELVSPERAESRRGPTLKPEAIPVNVKVILLGDSRLYHALDALDSDFPHLFKVLADFESTIPRNDDGLAFYAGVLARSQTREDMRAFDREAVALLIEHGARIASEKDRLTARFSRLLDIAREASFLAKEDGRTVVGAQDVRAAVRRSKERANLPARKYREKIAEGSIRVMTQGKAVGQVNGLAVIQAGPLSYGFPSRITATIGPGQNGAINIEREAELSGAIHTKGFYILGGLLRYLLRTDHPLAFDASIAFEQSYGGIDGDSASGAEMCCLLSALTDIPIRQGLAMTGAIDQVGNILPIGAVNEKIEGFFDACKDLGLTGDQGVIVPTANAGDLMLREDVVEAAAAGDFHVYAVETIHQAVALFTEHSADEVLAKAVERARHFWDLVDGTVSRPRA